MPANYHGPLFAEIAPRAFSILVRRGDRLNQIRIKRGTPLSSDDAMRRLNERDRLVDPELEGEEIKRGVPITVDLAGSGAGRGDRLPRAPARRADRSAPAAALPMPRSSGIRSGPGASVCWCSIRASSTSWPPSRRCGCRPTAAEMLAYDTAMGEFRVHYAGFFDPGFGHPDAGGADAGGAEAGAEAGGASAGGARGALPRVPFVLEDGQRVGA